MINRKGEAAGAGVIYIIYLIMMVIILLGVAIGVYAYYGGEIDFRKQDSKILLKKTMTCFSENDFFKNEFTEKTLIEKQTIFFDKCKMSKKVLEGGDYLVYVTNLDKEEFFVGIYDYKIRCGFDEGIINKNLPKCSNDCMGDVCFLVASSQNSRKRA